MGRREEKMGAGSREVDSKWMVRTQRELSCANPVSHSGRDEVTEGSTTLPTAMTCERES